MLTGIDGSRAAHQIETRPSSPDGLSWRQAAQPNGRPVLANTNGSVAAVPFRRGAAAAPIASPASLAAPAKTTWRLDSPFADGLRGTQPQHGDLLFAEMSNDCYRLPMGPAQSTGSQSEVDLRAKGWTRMQPSGRALLGADGRELAIDPASLENEGSGLRAAIYTDGQGHYVAAFAGTHPTQFADIRTDAAQGVGMRTAQYEQAVDLATKLQRLAGPGHVAFTGHSLGGGLAAAASAATGAPAVTLNAAGVSNETLRHLGYMNPNDARATFQTNGQIRSYSVDGDPLTTVDEEGAPAQLGAQWHAAWKNPRGDISDPRNIRELHGLPGDGQSYVEILRNGNMKPGVVTNPYVTAGISLLFSPMGSAAHLVPVRGAVLDQFGHVGTTVQNALRDLIQIGGNTASDVRGDLRRGGPLVSLRVGGELQEGGFAASGALLDNAHDFAGRTVTVATDHIGEGIRDMAQVLHLPQGVTTFGARSLEHAGNATRIGMDRAGDRVEDRLDAAGSAADRVANRVADAGEAVVAWVRVAVPT